MNHPNQPKPQPTYHLQPTTVQGVALAMFLGYDAGQPVEVEADSTADALHKLRSCVLTIVGLRTEIHDETSAAALHAALRAFLQPSKVSPADRARMATLSPEQRRQAEERAEQIAREAGFPIPTAAEREAARQRATAEMLRAAEQIANQQTAN